MKVEQRTYVAHDISLFFTKNEMMPNISTICLDEFEAKKCFLDLIVSLKSFFSQLDSVQLEFPNNASSGNILYQLHTDNEQVFDYLKKACQQIIEKEFLEFFVHINMETRKKVFDSSQVKTIMQKQLKSYFLFNSLTDSLSEEKMKVKKPKI